MRKTAGFFLGEDGLTIYGNFEDTARRRQQLKRNDFAFVLMQEFFRQTDGFGQIASGGAVLERDFDIFHFFTSSRVGLLIR